MRLGRWPRTKIRIVQFYNFLHIHNRKRDISDLLFCPSFDHLFPWVVKETHRLISEKRLYSKVQLNVWWSIQINLFLNHTPMGTLMIFIWDLFEALLNIRRHNLITYIKQTVGNFLLSLKSVKKVSNGEV